MEEESAAKLIYDQFQEFFSLNSETYEMIGDGNPIPFFDYDLVLQMVIEMKYEVTNNMKMVQEVEGNAMIIGDIHGNVLDLIRLMTSARELNPDVLIFLGDYVDRGDFSVEVLLLIFSFYFCWKDKVKIIILRGNHEFRSVNEKYGFKDTIFSQYGNCDLWEQFNDLFDYLPLACILNGKYFCTHGGISPNIKSIDQIREIKRPLSSFENDDVVYPLMWADPGENVGGHLESMRGEFAFSDQEITRFLENNNLYVLIRGHEMVRSGIRKSLHKKVITVFSSGNYGFPNSENRCGFLLVHFNGKINGKTLPFMYQLHRDTCDTKFVKRNLLNSNKTRHTQNLGKFAISPSNSYYTSPRIDINIPINIAKSDQFGNRSKPELSSMYRCKPVFRKAIRGATSNLLVHTFM